MLNSELFNQLSYELELAAKGYKQEITALYTADGVSVLGLLADRCEKFNSEIHIAVQAAGETPEEDAATEDDNLALEMARIKEREEIFARIEERESRLERLYREVLRCDSQMPGELRELLQQQQQLVCEWHNFVITEEINFILAGEVKIPRELQEKTQHVSIK